MSRPEQPRPLNLIAPPYAAIRAVTGGKKQLKTEGRRPGSALVWAMGSGNPQADSGLVESRPGGLALILILPPAEAMPTASAVADLVARTRPSAILPYHGDLAVEELAHVLRRPPEDLGSEVTDYLSWRGIRVDRDTRHLVRRTVELSAELRSVTALSRSLYMSRRALGRRFFSRGLPVPSHWLQFSRLLRVTIQLQNTDNSVLAIGYDLGYPDGFSVSNQMQRLTGYRPNDVRRCWGWEWLLEAWLRREAEAGALSPEHWGEEAGGDGIPGHDPVRNRRPVRRPYKTSVGGRVSR